MAQSRNDLYRYVTIICEKKPGTSESTDSGLVPTAFAGAIEAERLNLLAQHRFIWNLVTETVPLTQTGGNKFGVQYKYTLTSDQVLGTEVSVYDQYYNKVPKFAGQVIPDNTFVPASSYGISTFTFEAGHIVEGKTIYSSVNPIIAEYSKLVILEEMSATAWMLLALSLIHI